MREHGRPVGLGGLSNSGKCLCHRRCGGPPTRIPEFRNLGARGVHFWHLPDPYGRLLRGCAIIKTSEVPSAISLPSSELYDNHSEYRTPGGGDIFATFGARRGGIGCGATSDGLRNAGYTVGTQGLASAQNLPPPIPSTIWLRRISLYLSAMSRCATNPA